MLKYDIEGENHDIRKVPRRAAEIWQYIHEHPNVKAFCAIDDMSLAPFMEGHYVETWGCSMLDDGTLSTTNENKLGLNRSDADMVISHITDPAFYLN